MATKKDDNTLECSACGFPNRNDDSRCIYCATPLTKNLDDGERGKVFSFKEPRKPFPPSSSLQTSASNLFRIIFYLAISTALLIAGVTVFYLGLKGGSFLYILLGLLFSLYGGTALHNFLKERGFIR